MRKYHGPGYPGGVAHAFEVMERAFPLLDSDIPPERREIVIDGLPGALAPATRAMVTRAVTGERYAVDRELERPERSTILERYVFRLRYRDRTVTLMIRDGFVTDEFHRAGSEART